MNIKRGPKILRGRKILRAVFVVALVLSALSSRATVIYASYNDHTGYTRPDTIEKFDLETGADLGPFAAHTGLSLPNGLAFDASGNLYVANYGDNTIEKFTPDGVGSVFANTGLNGPWGLVFDKAGNLYAANYWGNSVSKITPAGVVSTFFSTGLTY